MTQVTNVTVKYGRERQPAKYESAEAMIEFSATLSDGVNPGEDHVKAAQRLLGEAKTLVLTELGLVQFGESASAPVIAAAAAAEGTGTTAAAKKAAAKAAKNAPAAETRQISTGEARVSPDDDDPTAGGKAVTTTTAAASNAGSADLPDEGVTAKPSGKPGVTLSNAEVQAAVTTLIKDKRIDVKTVKDLSRGYGVERIADIPADKLAEYKGKIDAAVEAASDSI